MPYNHHLDHKRPDIVVLEKKSSVCQIIERMWYVLLIPELQKKNERTSTTTRT